MHQASNIVLDRLGCVPHPAPDKRQQCPPLARGAQQLPLRWHLWRWRQAQQLREFVLDINNRLSAREVRLKAGILAPQAGQVLGERVRNGFWAALLWREGLQLAVGSEAAPLGELGGVQAFATEQGADLAGLSTGVSLLENAQLLSSGELAACSLRRNLWVRLRRGARKRTTESGGIVDSCRCFSTPSTLNYWG